MEAYRDIVRFYMATGENGLEPTLLLSQNSLVLKLLMNQGLVRISFHIVPGSGLLYIIRTDYDPVHAGFAWSVVERVDELEAITAVAAGEELTVFLFNEVGISVAWWKGVCTTHNLQKDKLLDAIVPIQKGSVEGRAYARSTFNQSNDPDWQLIHPYLQIECKSWQEISSNYIGNHAERYAVDLLSGNEGAQQEMLSAWLADRVRPSIISANPRLTYSSKLQEFCDVVFGNDRTLFIVSSKNLTVLQTETTPTRTKLEKRIRKHMPKATPQVGGAIRALKTGLEVQDANGDCLTLNNEVDRIHSLILVPDLSLLHEAYELGPEFVTTFYQRTGSYLQIIDPNQLFRLVHAANFLSVELQDSPFSMVDRLASDRWAAASRHATPNFDFITNLR